VARPLRLAATRVDRSPRGPARRPHSSVTEADVAAGWNSGERWACISGLQWGAV
jgi:hypothetical protein